MSKFTMIDLFSGLGGFTLAAEQVWGKDLETLFFCEINPFCKAVLRKNFGKEIRIYDNIKKVTKEQFIKDTLSNGCILGEIDQKETEIRGQWQFGTGDGNGIHNEKINTNPNGNGLQEQGSEQQTGGDRQSDENAANPFGTDGRGENNGGMRNEEWRIRPDRGAGIQSQDREPCPDNFESGSNNVAASEKCGLEKYGVCERPTVIKDDIGNITNPKSEGLERRSWDNGSSEWSSSSGIENNGNEIRNKVGCSDRIRVDLLTAGPPCQAASAAGKRKGSKDDRWLWEELFKVIGEFKPTWCVIENVYGLVSLDKGVVFDSLLSKMESLGYEVQPFVVGAVSKNAPHKRYRVWFIAHSLDSTNRADRGTISEEDGVQGINRETLGTGVFTGTVVELASQYHAANSNESGSGASKSGIDRNEPQENQRRDKLTQFGIDGYDCSNAADSEYEGCVGSRRTGNPNGAGVHEGEQSGEETRSATARCGEEYVCDDRDSEGTRQSSSFDGQGQEQHGGTGSAGFEGWDEDWFEVATKFCRVDDGVSVNLDEFKLTASKHREERLKALGNAIVVPLVASLLQIIKQVEDNNPVEEEVKKEKVKFITLNEKKNGEYFAVKDLRNFGVKEEKKT